MFTSTNRRRRSFQPAVLGLDMRVMPIAPLPPGGCVPMVPLTEMVSLVPPSDADETPSNDLASTISLTDGL